MKTKTIALVAHDNCKKDLVEWVTFNQPKLIPHNLVCTGTTGRLVVEALNVSQRKDDPITPVRIKRLKSGPLGGDQQLGAMIAEGTIDILIFFWDPMQPQPHDVDVKALTRIAVLYNTPTATNRATADFIITSPLFDEDYDANPGDFDSYVNREVK
jgi:methylglyoxal synthase